MRLGIFLAMLLKKFFALLLLPAFVLCQNFGAPTITYDGDWFSVGSKQASAVLSLFEKAFASVNKRLMQGVLGNEPISSTFIRAGTGILVCTYHSASPEFGGTSGAHASPAQIYDAYNRMNSGRSARGITSGGLAILKSAAGCTVGVLSYQFTPRHDELRRRALDDGHNNTTFSTGIHYIPQNDTMHVKYPERLPPSNGLCKRHDAMAMMACVASDTLLPGFALSSGGRIYSSVGHYAELQSDGNLCTTDNKGKKYWCAMTHDTKGGVGKRGPYSVKVLAGGFLWFYTKNGEVYKSLMFAGQNDSYYRLTMQNDGNLVMYRGTDNSAPVWTSQTTALYNYKVDAPCTGRLYMN